MKNTNDQDSGELLTEGWQKQTLYSSAWSVPLDQISQIDLWGITDIDFFMGDCGNFEFNKIVKKRREPATSVS